MDQSEIGRQLRARRTAAGRTVASVAADAGLSVPYIANLENGRGNPTTAALTRLAEALGLRLVVTLVPGEEGPATAGRRAGSAVRHAGDSRLAGPARAHRPVPAGGRGDGAGAGRWPPTSSPVRLVAALAALAQAMGRDLAEADWWRLLDALMLVAAHPAAHPAAHQARMPRGPGRLGPGEARGAGEPKGWRA